MILITVLVMALSAVPVSAVENSPAGNVWQYRYIASNPPIEPMTSFSPCMRPGCTGVVSLVCSGRMKSDNTPAPFACTFSAHYDYGNCNHYSVIYYNSGKCNSCNLSVDTLSAKYNFTNTTHNHAYIHNYLISGTTYTTEYIPACYI